MSYCKGETEKKKYYRGEPYGVFCMPFFHHFHVFGPRNPLGCGKDWYKCCRCLIDKSKRSNAKAYFPPL